MTISPSDDLAARRANSPITQARNIAYGILMAHAPALADEIPLDGLAEDIAQAILKGVDAEEVKR